MGEPKEGAGTPMEGAAERKKVFTQEDLSDRTVLGHLCAQGEMVVITTKDGKQYKGRFVSYFQDYASDNVHDNTTEVKTITLDSTEPGPIETIKLEDIVKAELTGDSKPRIVDSIF